jgi:hypothetical protein
MSNSHVYSTCGNYIITVKNWDMNQPNDTCYGYNAVNISCDGPTGIRDHAFEGAQELLFPNPFTDRLFFSVKEPLRGIALKDITGREFYRKEYDAVTEDGLELSEIAPGMYVFVFIYKDGKQRNMKFIKK